MSKRRPKIGGDFSLFPFLGIVVSVIGLLTLMIAISSLGEIVAEADPMELERSKEFRALRSQLQADAQQLDDLNDRTAGSDIGQARLDAARRELEEIQEKARLQKESRDASSSESARLQAQIEEIQRRIQTIEEQSKERSTLLADLDRQVEERRLDSEQVVSLRPSGTGQNLEGVFVECTDSGVVLLEEEPPVRIRAEDIGASPPFLKLLDRVSATPSGVVVFLLRDNGAGAYWTARQVADGKGCRNGKIPVVGHGRIDLSRLKRKR
jgi:Skp family chaperone for outer membrane proteins